MSFETVNPGALPLPAHPAALSRPDASASVEERCVCDTGANHQRRQHHRRDHEGGWIAFCGRGVLTGDSDDEEEEIRMHRHDNGADVVVLLATPLQWTGSAMSRVCVQGSLACRIQGWC